MGGQEYHRQIYAAVPQLGQKIDARRSREFPVENDDVGIGGGVERAEQRLPVAEALDGKSTFRQFVAKDLAVMVVILDEQDLPPVQTTPVTHNSPPYAR